MAVVGLVGGVQAVMRRWRVEPGMLVSAEPAREEDGCGVGMRDSLGELSPPVIPMIQLPAGQAGLRTPESHTPSPEWRAAHHQ